MVARLVVPKKVRRFWPAAAPEAAASLGLFYCFMIYAASSLTLAGCCLCKLGNRPRKKRRSRYKKSTSKQKPPLRRRRRHSRVLFICARWPFVSLGVCVCVNIFMGLLTRFGNPVNGIFIVYKTFGTNCPFSCPSICLLHPCYMNAMSRVFEKYCLIINSNNNKIIWLLNCKTKWFMKYIFI